MKLFQVLIIVTLFSYDLFGQQTKEFRGVWIATVQNIDWPRGENFSEVDFQKRSFIRLLESYKELNFNAVIVQIRTAGDVFYPSEYEPWSRFLTGKEGQPPRPYYDPLQFMIDEAHKRGLEFHAWINPYRATTSEDTTLLALDHPFNVHRDWMIKYGTRYYFNPGLPEVRDYITKVIDEIVSNYDIDAIHFDDYFYPYRIEGEQFDDGEAFRAYGTAFGQLDNWRRANVDSLVKNLNASIKKRKPGVKFGISPFGIWRNKKDDPSGSDSDARQTSYDDLFANALLWIREGWIDYLAPQLYWSMDYPIASFRKLSLWWAAQESKADLYIGMGVYKVKNNHDKAWRKKSQIPRQIEFIRSQPNLKGMIFFSAKSLQEKNRWLFRKLRKKSFANP